MDDGKIKMAIELDTAAAEAQIDALAAKAKSLAGATLNLKTIGIVVGLLWLITMGLIIGIGVLTLRQHRALDRAQAISEQQQQTIHAAQQSLAAREAAWQQERAKWEAERAAIRTAPQAIKVIERYLPAIAGQTVAGVPAAQVPPEVTTALPPTPTVVISTPEAEMALARAVQAGQECEARTLKLSADGVDLRDQVHALTVDRDTWRATARGGSIARRLGRGALVGLCGAGGAAIGSGQGRQGAAIGSLIGAVACMVATK